MVANKAMNGAPSSLTYYSVVSSDHVHLDFLIYGLNDLYIMACDIGNAYLMHLVERIFCSQKFRSMDWIKQLC